MQPHVVKNVTSENTAPNFAFPDKVAADADIQLSKALNEGNGQEVVDTSGVFFACQQHDFTIVITKDDGTYRLGYTGGK